MLLSVFLAAFMCIGLHSHQVVGHHGHDHGPILGPIFTGNEVVPDVLDEAPTMELKVEYSNDISVNFANVLTPTQVKAAPQVAWEAEPESFYTLLMVDPDAPSRANPEHGEWLHWGVVNIPGNNLTAGQTIAEYVGSGPPMGSGLHRYVFLVYKQEHSHDFNEPIKTLSDPNRSKFSTRNFAKKHELGKPLAGNFYQAEYDDYVPILYSQFKE